MPSKLCLITGANSGIGKQASIGLAKRGYTIVMLARNKMRGEKAREEIIAKSNNPQVDLMIADLASMVSVRRFAEAFRSKYLRLDVLINNAGVLMTKRRLSKDGYEMTLAVNHLGHFLLTNLLLDMLIKSAPARIIIVSSTGHRYGRIHFQDLQLHKYGPVKSYAQSKLANLYFTYELAEKLRGKGVSVNAVHPGAVATNLWRDTSGFMGAIMQFASPLIKQFMKSPKEGAKTIIYLAASDDVQDVTGKYFVNKRAIRSSKSSYIRDTGKRLWRMSEVMTGLAK